MLSVVTFLWKPKPGYRSQYGPEHALTLARMVRRHYREPCKIICFNDHFPGPAPTYDVDTGLIWSPLWNEHADLIHPHGERNPSCYRRLKLYSEWAREAIGPRILSIDLDMVITGDVTDLWSPKRKDAFVFWEDQLNRHGRVNGAMQLITPGARDDVWSSFDPHTAKNVGREQGKWGSDQGWLAHKFKPEDHGRFAAPMCVSWRVHCKPHGGALPAGAKVVNFHGPEDPWTLAASIPWIAEHYR